MKKLFDKYRSINLIIRITAGLVLGTALGVLSNFIFDAGLDNSTVYAIHKCFAMVLQICGNLFIGALRSIAPVLVFFLISTSLMQKTQSQSSTIRRQICLYIIGTFLAALTAVVINMLFKASFPMPEDVSETQTGPAGMSEVLINLFNSVVTNPLQSIADANFLGVLFWSIMFGLAIREFAGQGLKDGFNQVTDALTKIVRIIIEFAPFGICGLVYTAIEKSGAGIFSDYGKLLLVYLTCTFLMFFVLNPLIVFCVLRRNPYPLLWETLKNSAFTAFFFRSSAANIPVNMALCKKLGLDKSNYSISIPLGATINMEGAAITIITLTLACCYSMGISVDFGPALVLSIIATISAVGASGVSGGSILLVPMACSLFGISGEAAAAVVAVGFIIGVVQDSVETALNSSTDVLFTATIQFYEKIKAGKDVHKCVGGTLDDIDIEIDTEIPKL